MRLRLYLPLLLVPVLLSLYVLVTHIVTFVQIFFEHSGIAITQDEIAAAHVAASHVTGHPDPRPQLIPKIFHHIFHDWHNVSMPEEWVNTRQTCLETHVDWEFMLWSEDSSREFLSTHYPWFLQTYDGYPYPVQRVDVVKYFLMLHYGGVYLDMDNGCSADFTPLLYYPTWTTDGGRGALSNNVFGASPNHPFWQFLTNSLIPYSYNYLFPYVTISYASGQWFETAVWDAYHARLPASVGTQGMLHRIMMDDRPGMDHWVYFTQTVYGGTWNSWDNVMFLWIGDHLVLLGLGVSFLIGLVYWVAVRCFKLSRRARPYQETYLPLIQGDEEAGSDDLETEAREKSG